MCRRTQTGGFHGPGQSAPSICPIFFTCYLGTGPTPNSIGDRNGMGLASRRKKIKIFDEQITIHVPKEN